MKSFRSASSKPVTRRRSRIDSGQTKRSTTNRLRLEKLEARQLLAFNIADDTFYLSSDASLNVLSNDTSGEESQTVSAKNVDVDKATANRTANTADNFIPERPGQPGVPQRSVFEGAMTLWRPQQNYGDIDIYLDLDADPSNDDDPLLAGLQKLNVTNGIVLGTLRDNSPLNEANNPPGDAARTNLAVVQYTWNAAGDAWIATNASPENRGEAAVDYSAAYFPYAAGWRGASFDGNAALSPGGVASRIGGDAGIVATGALGVYEITVDGVTDSFSEGFLFALGGDNVDNYARAMPLGGNKWQLIHRDNANGIDGSDTDQTQQKINVLYVPRSAQGLIGGVVNGAVADVNPMRQSFGDFNIQRQSEGIWKLTVPGQNITSGVVVMETADTTAGKPRNAYFTYDVDPDDAQSILIRQFNYNSPNAELANQDFTFLFIPFENTIQPETVLGISALGSDLANLGDNVSQLGIPLSVNPDGTVGYATGSAILALGQGQSAVDTFVYEVTFVDGDGNNQVGTATATVNWNGVNDAPFVTSEPSDLNFARNGAATAVDATDFFSDPDTDDVLVYSATVAIEGVVTVDVVGGIVTITPVANASGVVDVTITATDPYGVTASVTLSASVIGLDAIDDVFFVSGDTILSVLNNDRNGSEVQNVSAMNLDLVGPQNRPANTGLSIIPERPGQPGIPQRSVYAGAMTINPAQNNFADYDLFLDNDTDPSNDSGSNARLVRGSGIVLATLRDNSPLTATANNLAVVQYTGATNSWIATNASPQNGVDTANAGENAAEFGAAYFPYSAGWKGGSYNSTAGTVAGGSGLTVTGSGGRYEAVVSGVADSFNEGFLFGIGGDNSDNYTRTRPVGDGKWLVQHRDNASAITGAEAGAFNLLYIPRNAPGLIGGVVNGSSDVSNPMLQSFGDFNVQRETNGFWRLNIPGQSPTSGVLVMETMDLSVNVPRNSYFTYEADPANPNDFIIRQFDFISGTNTANPQNGNFVFFFIPFENTIQSSQTISVGAVGSSAATLGNNVTAKGIPITINSDGTINYDTSGAIRALAEGQTDTDSFVYEAVFGTETELATVTINWVGANDAPELIATPADINIAEDASTTLDLTTVFEDPDTTDTLTYSVSLSRTDIVDAQIVDDELTITGLENKFGFVLATITATDPFGASVTTRVGISVSPETDGPEASDDSLTTGKLVSVDIDVLANDVHPDSGRFQVVGANIFGNAAAANDAETAWAIEQTGTGDNVMTLYGPQNRGDLSLGVNGTPVTAAEAVLLGTIRNDAEPFGSVNVWQWAARDNTLTFATELGAGGNGERNAPLGAAFVPLTEGWVGGHVLADGTIQFANGINSSNVTKIQTGLWSVSIPGVTDSNTDGLLFAMGGNNDDNFVTVLPMGGDTWLIRQADNDTDNTGFEDDPFSFVYIPYTTQDLIAGRWEFSSGEEDEGSGSVGAITASSGTFTATDTGAQSVLIDIPGVTPADGSLIVIPNNPQDVLLPDGSTVSIPSNYGAFYAETVDGKFEVTMRQGVDFLQVQSGFQFMFVPFEDVLRTDLGHKSVTTVTAVDPVSALGAAVSINTDGTVNYDSTAAGGAIAALNPGEFVIDTFSYTVTDGNGLESTATVSVRNYVAPTFELTVDSASIEEAGGVATVTATLSAVSTLDITIDLTVGGTATAVDDYTISGAQIVIPAGQTTGSVVVTAVEDAVEDPDETVIIGIAALSNVDPGTAQEVTVTIVEAVNAPPAVESVSINGGDTTRSQITSVSVTFDTEVDATEILSAFTLTNIDTNQEVGSLVVTPTVEGGKTTVVLTFGSGLSVVDRAGTGALANSLADGNYRLDILATQVKAVTGSVAMLADYVFGGQTAGQPDNDDFFRLYGDETGDGFVDGLDFNEFLATFANPSNFNPDFDSNGDGFIDGSDLNDFLPALATSRQ